MSSQPNLFDGRLALIFWTARSVSENTIAELASNLRAAAPNVNAVCFKTSNGTVWQSFYDTTKPDLMVGSMADVRRWSDTLAAHGLEPHAWHVVRGQSPDQEADRIAEICLRGGVRSMLLDLETGPSYFVGDRNAAQTLAVGLRQRVGADFHLGLIFDARGTYPQRLWVQDIWFPEIDSLHPMVYPYHFGISAKEAFRSLQAAIGQWGKPIYPMIEGYSPNGYPPYSASDIPATAAVTVNSYRTTGLSIFRYGKGLDIYDGVGRGDLSEVAKITLYGGAPVVVVTPPVPTPDTPPSDGVALVTVDPSNETTGEFSIHYYGDPDVISPGWAVELDANNRPYAYRPASNGAQTIYVTYQPALANAGNYMVEVFIPRNHANIPDAHYVVVDHPGGVRREVTVVLNQAFYKDAWVPLQGSIINGVPGGPLVTQFELDPAQLESGRVNLADVTFVDPQERGNFEITFGAMRWRPV
jgi:hypothetical protein